MPSYMASYEDLNQSSRHDVLDYDPNAVFDESAAADSFALTSIAESEDDDDDDDDSGISSRSSRSSSSRSSSRSSRSSRSRSRRRPRFTERRRISLESTITGIDDDDDVEPTPSELTATSNNGAGNTNNLYPQLHELQPGGFHPTRQDDDKKSTRHQQQQQQQDEEQYQNDAPRRRRSLSPFIKRNQHISSLYPQLHELELSSGGYNPRDKHNEWEQQQQGDDSTTVSIKTDDAPHDNEQGYRENIGSPYDDVPIAREGTSSTINTTPDSSSSSHDSRQKQRTNNGGGNTKHNSNTKAKAKKRVMKRRLVKIQLCDSGGSNNKNEMSTVVTVAMNVAQHQQQDGILLGGRNDSSLGVGQRIHLEQLHQHDSNGYSKSSNWGKDEQRTVDISWQQTPSSHFGATGAFNNKNSNQGEEEEQVWKPPLDLSQGELQQQQQVQPSPANSNTNTGSSSRWKPSFDVSSKQRETTKGIKHTERGIIQQGRRVGVDRHRDYYGGDQHGRVSSRDEEERVNQPQQSTSLEPSGSRLSQMNSSAEPPTPNPLKVSIQQQQQQSKLSTSSMEKSPRSVKHEEEDLAWEEKKDDHNNNVLPPTQQQQQPQPTSTTLLSTSMQPTPSSVKGLEPFTIPSILTTTVLKSTPTEKVGLAFRKANGTIVIEKIVPGSAFDGTALRPGFECLCINGHRLRSARRAAEIVRESGYSLTLMASNAPRPPGTMYTMISLDTIVSSSRDTTQDAVSVSSVGGGYACGMYFKMKHGLVQLVKVDPTNSPISSTSIKMGDFVLAMNGQVIGGIGKAVEVLSEVSTKSNDHDSASASSSGGNNVPILYFNMRQLRVSLVDKVIGDLWKKEWNEKYDECVVLQPSSSSEQSGGSAANGQPLTLRFKEEGMCELLDPLRGFRNEKGGDSVGVPSNHPLNSVVETLNHGIICVLSAIREGVELATTAAGSPSSSSSHGNNSKKSNDSSGGIVAELSKLSASPVE